MSEPTRRRDFVRHLAAGAAAGLVGGSSLARAEDPPKTEDAKPAEAPKVEPKSEADARMDLVLARYGDKLDDDARKAVRDEMNGIVRRAQALRKFELSNGDGPFPVFVPFRGPLT